MENIAPWHAAGGEEALDRADPDVCLNSHNHQILPTLWPANPGTIRPDWSQGDWAHVDWAHIDLANIDLASLDVASLELASFDQDFCQHVVQALDEQGIVPRTEPQAEDLLDAGGEVSEFVQFPGAEFMGAGPADGSDLSGRVTTQLDPPTSQGPGIGQHESAPLIGDPGGENRSALESSSPGLPSNDDHAYQPPTLSEPVGWYATGDGSHSSSSTAPAASDKVGPVLPSLADSASSAGLQESSSSTNTASTWHSPRSSADRGGSLDIGVAPLGGVTGLANLSGDVARASLTLSPLAASQPSARQGSTWPGSTPRSSATDLLPGNGRFFTASATVPPLTLQHETARDPHVEFVLGRTPSPSAPASPGAPVHDWALHGPPSPTAANGRRGPNGSPTTHDAATGSRPQHEPTLPSARRRVALVTTPGATDQPEIADQPAITNRPATTDSSTSQADRTDSSEKTIPLTHQHELSITSSATKLAATPVASLAWLVAWRPIVSKLMLWGFSSCLLLPQVCRSRRLTQWAQRQ